MEEDAPLEVEGAEGREDIKRAKDKNINQEGEVEIEVENDTTEADCWRKAPKQP